MSLRGESQAVLLRISAPPLEKRGIRMELREKPKAALPRLADVTANRRRYRRHGDWLPFSRHIWRWGGGWGWEKGPLHACQSRGVELLQEQDEEKADITRKRVITQKTWDVSGTTT